MHAVLALGGREFRTTVAWKVGVQFEHGLLLDHDPSNPRIGQGQDDEKTDNGSLSKIEILYAQSEGQKHTGGEDVDGPFKTHGNRCRWTLGY